MPDRKRTYHGVSIGILMLDTSFERFNGDIGNACTWPFPVQYRIVHDATPNRVTRPEGPDMLDAFMVAADDLIAAGVDGISTTCGFLALYQRELAAHCTRAGRDQLASAGADGGANSAGRKAAGDSHLLRGIPHLSPSRGSRRRSGDANLWHAPGLGVPAFDPRGRHLSAICHSSPRGARGRRSHGARGQQYRRVGVRMHEPHALFARYRPPDRPARLRHGDAGALVPPQPEARALLPGFDAAWPRR